RFAAYFVRCLVILFGYAIAALAASAFINVLFLGSAGFTAEETRLMASGPLVVTIPLLAAGHETTAATLGWAFERLSRHPDVLAALVEEVDNG
ncbi:cytochrome P450, partial [Mycobacterium tuberculosis]